LSFCLYIIEFLRFSWSFFYRAHVYTSQNTTDTFTTVRHLDIHVTWYLLF
jgi:hypothetical protein